MEHIGVIIRKRRKECALKLYQLAKKVGVCPVYITQIEKHGKLPSPVVMKRISEVLCDDRLFDMYLKTKYPVLYGEVNKRKIEPRFYTIRKVLLWQLRNIRKNLERMGKWVN